MSLLAPSVRHTTAPCRTSRTPHTHMPPLLIFYLLVGLVLEAEAEVVRLRCGPFDESPPGRSNSTEQLGMLRAEMKRAHSVQGAPLEAYIVTSYDAHLNELVADRDKRLEYISGFTGSRGLAVVTGEKAALWTSELYIDQANEELPCDWLLMNESTPIADWIASQVQSGLRIGADPKLMPNSQWETLAKQLNEKFVYLIPIQNNLVEIIWSRPKYTFHEAMPLVFENSGDAWFTKVSHVRAALADEKCDALVVTALDEIAWLLNVRGRDLPYTPVLRSYLIISKDQLHLYTDRAQINEKVKTRLRIEGCYTSKCVRLHGYDIIYEDLVTMSQKWDIVCLPTETALSPGVSRAIFFAVPVVKRKTVVSPILKMKAEKNEHEREGMRKAHLEDAVAMCYAMSFINNKVKGREKLDELTVADLIDSARRERTENEGISFRTTVAFGPHAAFPRYQPKNTTSVEVNKTSLLLVDSGGQYLGGTTDVSRTFHFGTPTEEEKEVYTRILMGHIDLARLTFPESITIGEIEVFARAPLWDSGRDYMHETGHGIGSFLSVQEGPILLSRNQDMKYTFKEGYFLTIEPGYYKKEKFGIRLESVLEVVRINKSTNGQIFLGFNPVTLVPFEPKLMKVAMLGPEQVKWLNAYNGRIRNEVGAELKKYGFMTAFYWMMDKVTFIPELEYSFSSARNLNTCIYTFSSIQIITLFLFTLRHQNFF